MLVGFKFASLFTLGVALSGAVALSSKKGCTFLKNQENLTRTVEYEYPLFSCSGNSVGKINKYQFSLVLKSEPHGLEEKPKHTVYLEGKDLVTGKILKLREQIDSTPDDMWHSQVLDDQRIKISALSGADGVDYDTKDAYCVFKELQVTNGQTGDSRVGILWEKAIKNIEFELKGCDAGIVGEGCEIQIKQDVGLQLKTPLKPKEIFCSSRI